MSHMQCSGTRWLVVPLVVISLLCIVLGYYCRLFTVVHRHPLRREPETNVLIFRVQCSDGWDIQGGPKMIKKIVLNGVKACK